VPLLVKFPHSEEKRVVDAPVSLVDVVPTVLDITGQGALEELDGVTLQAAKPERPLNVMSETYSNSALHRIHPRFDRIQRAIFSADIKLVVSSTGRQELYDLATDPEEQHDGFKASPVTAAALQERMQEWLGRVEASQEPPLPMDSATRERLRALGYIR